MPWYGKVAAKLVLSRLPLRYSVWRRLNLFALGRMHKSNYAHKVFLAHFPRSDFLRKNDGFVALEIGPGDSLSSALIASAYGAKKCYLVDVGKFASEDMEIYRDLANYLKKQNLSLPRDIDEISCVKDMLKLYNTTYLTEGLRSLKVIPSQSIDFIWSQTVLQCILKSEFLGTLLELHRILTPGGICSHSIDLRDSMGSQKLNHFRFSSRLWESKFMASSGFYTNRIRYSEMVELFKLAGFMVEVINIQYFKEKVISRSALAKEFQNLSDDDLSISGFDVLLRAI